MVHGTRFPQFFKSWKNGDDHYFTKWDQDGCMCSKWYASSFLNEPLEYLGSQTQPLGCVLGVSVKHMSFRSVRANIESREISGNSFSTFSRRPPCSARSKVSVHQFYFPVVYELWGTLARTSRQFLLLNIYRFFFLSNSEGNANAILSPDARRNENPQARWVGMIPRVYYSNENASRAGHPGLSLLQQ